MSDAITTAQTDAKAKAADEAPKYGHITFDDVNYEIVKKPSTLLLSEMARTGTDDPEALGVIATFFEVTLGENYKPFRKAIYTSDQDDTEILPALLQEIVEKTLGRPTE